MTTATLTAGPVTAPVDYIITASDGGLEPPIQEEARMGRHWVGAACRKYRNAGFVVLSVLPKDASVTMVRPPFPRSLMLGLVVEAARFLYWQLHTGRPSKDQARQIRKQLVDLRASIYRHCLIDQWVWDQSVARRHAESIIDQRFPSLKAQVNGVYVGELPLF